MAPATQSSVAKTPYQQRLEASQGTQMARQAREYLEKHRVVPLFNALATAVIHVRPDDPKPWLAEQLARVRTGEEVEWNFFLRDRLEDQGDAGLGDKLVSFPLSSVVFVVGAPGLAGSGSRGASPAAKLAVAHNYHAVHALELLRAHARDEESPHHAVLSRVLDDGGPVPASVACQVLAAEIERVGNNRVVVDGFPLHPDDLTHWEEVVGPYDFVVSVDCSDKVLAERGAVASVSMKRRLAFFGQKTVPMIASLEEANRVRRVPWDSDSVGLLRSLEGIFTERTFAIIKPDAIAAGKGNDILSLAQRSGFRVLAHRKLQLDEADVKSFYAEHDGKGFFDNLVRFMTSGPCVVAVLERPNAIREWRRLLGPTSTDTAREQAPESIRALYGSDNTRNAGHGSDSLESAAREIGFFFPGDVPPPRGPYGVERALMLVTPDAVEAGRVEVLANHPKSKGYDVVLRRSVHLGAEEAKTLAAGTGVSAEALASGPSFALVVQKRNAVRDLQILAGPGDPAVARESAPRSMRALYGTDLARPGVIVPHGPAAIHTAAKAVFNDSAAKPSVDIERTLAVILPHIIEDEPERIEEILTAANVAGFQVVKQSRLEISADQAAVILESFADHPELDNMIEMWTLGPAEIIVLEKVSAVDAWSFLIGDDDADVAREVSPASLRALYGLDLAQNAVHGSKSVEAAKREIALFFSEESLPPMPSRQEIDITADNDDTSGEGTNQPVTIDDSEAPATHSASKASDEASPKAPEPEPEAQSGNDDVLDIDPNDPETQRAATRLQAVQRGRIARREVDALRAKKESGEQLTQEEQEVLDIPDDEEAQRAATRLQAMQRGRIARREVDALRAKKESGEQLTQEEQEVLDIPDDEEAQRAATRLQAMQRGRIARREVDALRAKKDSGEQLTQEEQEVLDIPDDEEAQRAATRLQAVQRGRMARREVEALKSKQPDADAPSQDE